MTDQSAKGLGRRAFLASAVAFSTLPFLRAPLALAIAPVRVDSVRLYRAPDHTRIVFDVSASVSHTVFPLANPDRLVIDLHKTSLNTSLDDLPLAGTPIQTIRSATRDQNDTRVVLDLSASVRPKSFVLKPNKQYGHRLVVDLFDANVTTVKSSETIARQSGGTRNMVIAIDAGHGGDDPGAIGPRGTREKDIALQIARELEKQLKKEPGMTPVMIRTGDYYIKLKERRRLAYEKYKADVMVSIHADAFTNPQAHGASVFALSRRGASSEFAAFLAKIENEADLAGGVADEDKSDVFSVLADMTVEGQMEHSIYMGGFILDELKNFARLHKKQVEQAGFIVLKEPRMLSLLVETGFISNPDEERKLRSRQYQQRLARSIMKGMKQYFYQYPEPGTWFAAEKNRTRQVSEYVISKGDTISGVARRFNVSIDDIRRLNGLKGDRVRVGQRLKIPAG